MLLSSKFSHFRIREIFEKLSITLYVFLSTILLACRDYENNPFVTHSREEGCDGVSQGL